MSIKILLHIGLVLLVSLTITKIHLQCHKYYALEGKFRFAAMFGFLLIYTVIYALHAPSPTLRAPSAPGKVHVLMYTYLLVYNNYPQPSSNSLGHEYYASFYCGMHTVYRYSTYGLFPSVCRQSCIEIATCCTFSICG